LLKVVFCSFFKYPPILINLPLENDYLFIKLMLEYVLDQKIYKLYFIYIYKNGRI